MQPEWEVFHRQRCSIFYAKADMPYPDDVLPRVGRPAIAAGSGLIDSLVNQEPAATAPGRGKINEPIDLRMISDLCRHALGEAAETVSPLPESGTFHWLYRASLAGSRAVIIRLNVLPGTRDFALYIDHWVMNRLRDDGLPALCVYHVDMSRRLCPCDYEILEEARGKTLRVFDDDDDLLQPLLGQLGRVVAGIHKIKADGFGLFDVRPLIQGYRTGSIASVWEGGDPAEPVSSARQEPRHPKLRNHRTGSKAQGCLDAWRHYLFLNLDRHLAQCAALGAITSTEAEMIRAVFNRCGELLEGIEPVLLHGDLGNHNIFTDGSAITAVIDWEDSLTGDPVFDIASWATFHPDRRHDAFLDGYREVRALPDDFQLRFWLYYLRIALAKTVLRKRLRLTDVPGRAPASLRIQKGLHHVASLQQA